MAITFEEATRRLAEMLAYQYRLETKAEERGDEAAQETAVLRQSQILDVAEAGGFDVDKITNLADDIRRESQESGEKRALREHAEKYAEWLVKADKADQRGDRLAHLRAVQTAQYVLNNAMEDGFTIGELSVLANEFITKYEEEEL